MNRTLIATLLITATLWAQNGSPQGTGPFPALMEQDHGLPSIGHRTFQKSKKNMK